MVTKSLIKLLRSIQCPVCKAPIDLYNGLYNGRYCCANYSEHYVVNFANEVIPPHNTVIHKEICRFPYNGKYYSIFQNSGEQPHTNIRIFEADGEGRCIFSFEPVNLTLNQKVFNFVDFDIEQAVNRIETIMVFM